MQLVGVTFPAVPSQSADDAKIRRTRRTHARYAVGRIDADWNLLPAGAYTSRPETVAAAAAAAVVATDARQHRCRRSRGRSSVRDPHENYFGCGLYRGSNTQENFTEINLISAKCISVKFSRGFEPQNTPTAKFSWGSGPL